MKINFHNKNNSLFKILPILIFFFAIIILPANANDTTLITVSGTASQEFDPDTCSVTLSVETQAKTSEEAQSQNNALMKQIKKAVTQQGINEKDIKTSNFYVSLIYENNQRNSDKMPKVIGYKAINSITITTTPDKGGKIIDTALQNGATSVYGVNFYLKNNASYKETVLNEAITNALYKANAIAKNLDKQVIIIESINEEGTRTNVSENYKAYLGRVSSDSNPTELNPGSISVSATVQVTVRAK